MTTQDIAELAKQLREAALEPDLYKLTSYRAQFVAAASALEHLLREKGKISRLEERVQALEELIVRLASKESYL